MAGIDSDGCFCEIGKCGVKVLLGLGYVRH